jgi:hypothetical protein
LDKIIGIIDFISRNRQTGTTTALVRLLDNCIGYLIVGSEHEADRIKDKYSHLKDNVFSIRKVISGGCCGLASGRVFFDTTAVYEILSRQEELIRINKEALEEVEKIGAAKSEILSRQEELVKITKEALEELENVGAGADVGRKFDQWSKK